MAGGTGIRFFSSPEEYAEEDSGYQDFMDCKFHECYERMAARRKETARQKKFDM